MSIKINTYVKFLWDEEEQIYKEVYSIFEEYDGKVALCKGHGGGNQVTTIRYAPYVEGKHRSFLDTVASIRRAFIGTSTGTILSRQEWIAEQGWSPLELIYKRMTGALEREYNEYVASFSKQEQKEHSSPFAGYIDIDVDNAFFGAGYLISSFPSLYDMFGKFMAGLDVEVLFAQEFEDTVNSPVVSDLVAAQSAMMDDDILINSLPRFQAGMRDINSVMSSSFVVGKAVIEDAKTKALSLFNADLKYRLIPIAVDRWKTHLEWNKNVVGLYAELMKFYYSAKTDVDETNYAMAAKNRLWPFTVLDFERAALGALQGATNTKTDVAGASTTAKVLSGALGGAAMGAMIGNTIPQSAANIATGSAPTYAGAGSLVGAGLGIAAALTY